MNRDTLALLIDVPWLVFLLVWIIKARNTRTTREKESSLSRYLVMLLLVAGYLLIFGPARRMGLSGLRFLPNEPAVAIAGVLMIWLGVGLAIWARFHLAENWSARVTIKEGHELIRTGPYARLRHPIYTGLLLATVGSAVAVGEWRGLLGVALALIAYWLKARREEAMLTQQFGAAFQEHRKHTGFLLPKLF